jgi:hypothetical protein
VLAPQPPILEIWCLRSSSVVVSSKGKKTKNKTTQNIQTKKTPQSVPSSNAIEFQ